MKSEDTIFKQNSKEPSISISPGIKKKLSTFIIYSVLIINSIIVLLPLAWLVSSSLKTQGELAKNVWGLPKSLNLENYYLAWVQSNLGVYLTNSLITTAVTIIVTIVTSSMIAYVLSRIKFKFNRFFYILFIAGMMVPIHSTVIPLYINTMNWNMQNNLIVLGLIYAAFRIPISVFILESFMVTIPHELEECAVIDGCGYWKIFLKVILPLCKEGLVTISILAAMSAWNDLLVSMLLLNKPLLKTLPIGLTGFIGEFASEYTQLCAALVIACLPNIILYIFMQEKMVKGMTAGAVKG